MYDIQQCPSYDMEALRALPDSFWSAFPDVSGKRVFIKPNLVVPPAVHEIASTTHVNILRLVIERLKDAGAEFIRIGECGFKGQLQLTLELSKYDRLVRRYGVEFVGLQEGPNFHKFTLQRFENQSDYLSLFGVKISDYVLDCDLVINLPKLKMHTMSFTTGSIKNMMGVMANKGNMHPRASSDILQKRLRDLYFLWKTVIQPRVEFVLVDGIIGSEYAEHTGLPVNSKLLIASDDMWEADALCAEAMGVDWRLVPYLRLIGKDLGARRGPECPRDLVIDYERPLEWRKF